MGEQAGNGEKEHLKNEIERLKSEKFETLQDRVEQNHEWCKSNTAGLDVRIRSLEQEGFRLAGERTVYGKILPFTAFIVSLAVAVMKVIELMGK